MEEVKKCPMCGEPMVDEGLEWECPKCGHNFTLTPKQMKHNTEKIIFSVLAEAKNKLRWKKLLKKTGISSRTLASHLKELESRGKIKRIVDASVYPPAVYYEIKKGESIIAGV